MVTAVAAARGLVVGVRERGEVGRVWEGVVRVREAGV